MSKAAASKLSSKNSRKPSVIEDNGPPSVDRDARIVCPFPEWNDEHVNILLKKLGTVCEQVEQVPPSSAKGAKPPTSARGAKPAQPREDDGIDSSILDFQFEPLALKDEQVEWKQISKRSKIRILRSRAPRHPFLTAPPTPDLPPTVEERVHELDAKAQEDAAAAADPKGKKKPTTPSTTAKAPVPAKQQQAAPSVEDQKKITLELQKIKHQEDLHAEVNVLEEHQAIEMYSEYADFPKLLRKGAKCRAFNSALYIVKHMHKHVSIGNYLWELIHPKAEGSDYLPSNHPFTKYIVKLWYMGCNRIVVVDDYVPHMQNDNTLSFPETSKNEIWPTILFKALLKLAKGREQQVFDDPLFTLQALVPGFSRQQHDPIEQQLRCIRILHSVIDHQKQNSEITPFDEFVSKRKEEQLRLKKEKEAQQLQPPIVSQQTSGLSSRAQTTQASRAVSAAPTARTTTAAGPQALAPGMLSAAPSAAPTARAAAPHSTTFSIPEVAIVQPEEPKKVARRLLFATCRSDPKLATEIKNLGLCPSKLYLIDDIKIHEEENLLRVMAMKTNWKGSCSYDDSQFWTAQFEESIGFARQDRLCSQATVNDFWITFTDFCKYFSAVHEFFETAVLEEKVVLFGQNLPQTFYCFVQNDAQLFMRLSRVSYRNAQQDRPPSAAPVPAKPGSKAAAQAAAQQQTAPQPSMEIVPLGTPVQCRLQVESYDWLLAQPFEKLSAVSLQLFNDVPHFVPVPAVPRPRTMLPNPEAALPEPTATARSAAPTSRVTTPQTSQHTGAVASSPAVSMQQQFQNYSILKFQLLEGSGQDLVLELLSDKRVANIGNEKEIFKQNLFCNITEIEDTYTNHQANGEWKLWFLKKLRIDEPLMFSAQLSLLDTSEQASQLASALEFGIVNNATNAYTPSYLGRILPIQLKPNGESGYNLVASSRMRPNSEGSSQATIPGGKFKLHMISSGLAPLYDNLTDLSPFHPVQLKGTYMPNSSRELFQYEVWAGEMSYAAMHLSLSNHIPTVLEVLCNGRLIYHGDIGKWNYMVVPCIEHTPSSAKGEAKCFLYRAIISEDYADYLLSKRLIAAERRFKQLVNERAQNAEDIPEDDPAAQRKAELANGKNSSRKPPQTPKQQQKPKAGAATGGKAAPTVRIPAKQDKPQVVEPTEEDNLRELDGINSSDSLSYELTLMYSSPNIYIEKLDPKRQKLEEYQSNWESKEPNRSTLAKESRENFYARIVRQEYQRLKELDALNNGTKQSKISIVLPTPEEAQQIRPPSKGTARSTKSNSTATTRPPTVAPKTAKLAEEPKPEVPKPVLNLNLVAARPTDPAWLRRGTTSWLDKEMEEYKQVLHPSKPSEHLSIITKEDLDERKQRLETSITMANRHLDELKAKRAQEHEEHEKAIRETETQLADFFKQMKQLQIEQKKRILDAVQLKQQKLQEALAAQEAANAPPGKGKPTTPSTAKRGK